MNTFNAYAIAGYSVGAVVYITVTCKAKMKQNTKIENIETRN